MKRCVNCNITDNVYSNNNHPMASLFHTQAKYMDYIRTLKWYHPKPDTTVCGDCYYAWQDALAELRENDELSSNQS